MGLQEGARPSNLHTGRHKAGSSVAAVGVGGVKAQQENLGIVQA